MIATALSPPMHVLAAEFDLRLRGCRSLKEKRAVLRPIIDGLANRHRVAVAEVDHLEVWQRGAIGVATVSGSAGHAVQVIDEAERFVWSFPEVEVLASARHWLEED